MSAPMRATAVATSNIALVKYWGKRDVELNLPATGSVAVTLDGLSTRTSIEFDESHASDALILNGRSETGKAVRVFRFLDLVRATYGVTARARVESHNDFPTGAGLASSASGFAALALACDAALDLRLSTETLSALARRGSGSAARSLYGGFTEMRPGEAADGSDAYAVPIAPPEHVPLRMIVAVTSTAEKAVGSTEAMQRTEATSPYYDSWLERTRADVEDVREAVKEADLPRMGIIAEGNCLRMHAAMLGAEPPLLYWGPATLRVIRAVWALRGEGIGAWFTIDAGPQVKVICDAADVDAVAARIKETEGVREVIVTAPGPGARVVEEVA